MATIGCLLIHGIMWGTAEVTVPVTGGMLDDIEKRMPGSQIVSQQASYAGVAGKSVRDLWKNIYNAQPDGHALIQEPEEIETSFGPLDDAKRQLTEWVIRQGVNTADRAGMLRYVRAFALGQAGDILLYSNPQTAQEMQRRIADAFNKLLEHRELKDEANPNVTILMHSLGTVVGLDTFSLLSDPATRSTLVQPDSRLATLLDSGWTLNHFITVGSPVSLFRLRGGNLPTTPAMRGRWINIYDSSDPVGFPLKPFYPKVEEVRVYGKGLPHLDYWTTPAAVEKISEVLRQP